MTPAEAQLNLLTDLYLQVVALREQNAMLRQALEEAQQATAQNED